MADSSIHDPALTIAVALSTGIVVQAVARHLRVPGIVLLLAAGVILGPDLLGVIQPEALGHGIEALVGFAVAVILFEGGMNLSLSKLARAGSAIRHLVTVGALVTAVGATLAAHFAMQWDWQLSILFGTLVIVTGPTVVTPLLKRLRVERSVASILEAEGVLIDPIGAIIAVVALEIVVRPTTGNMLLGVPDLLLRLGGGAAAGAVVGYLLSRVLRVRGLIPEDLTNTFTLSVVLVLFFVSNLLIAESGIAAVTMAGIVVRYLGTPVERELLEFKEQLTVMLIGLLFVILAADVRLAEVQALGWRGVLTVVLLVVVVRPIQVWISTIGTGLTWQQRAFLAYVAPRGIVAAAVASLFAVQLDRYGIPGGSELRALVFLVIGITVVGAGLTGGWVASALRLRRPSNAGWVILGAHALARKLARGLLAGGEEVLLIDVNPENCRNAEAEGMRVIHGNAMKETVLAQAELDTRAGVVGLTRNEEVNFLFAQKAKRVGKVSRLFVSLSDAATGVTPEMIHREHAHILFGGAHDVMRWADRLEHGTARAVRCRFVGADDGMPVPASDTRCEGHALPMVYMRHGVLQPVGDDVVFRKGDEVVLIIDTNFEPNALDLLRERGFVPKETTFTEEVDFDAAMEEAG